MKNNLKGELSISRRTGPDGSCIAIRIEDENSHLHVLELEISAEHFGNAVTGLSSQPMTYEINERTEFLGKVKERIAASVEVYENGFGPRERFSEILIRDHQKEGWILDPYLGSKGSISYNYKDKKTILNFFYYRYVDAPEKTDDSE